jgi:hypothetical protein
LDNEELKFRILDQLRDLVYALVIVVKEAFFGLVVIAAGNGLAWVIRHPFGGNGERFNLILKTLSDL